MNMLNAASIDHLAPTKVPILLPGDITPDVMREYEHACLGYFDHKSIEDNVQVHKIIVGLKDSHVHDWIAADHACIQSLTFKEFMTKFRTNYLEEHWEETTCRELLGISQSSSTFWDFAVKVQAKNSLLSGTDSHLDEKKLRHQIEAGMTEHLAKRCNAEKVNAVIDFPKWLSEVKHVDKAYHEDIKEFECIAGSRRDQTRRVQPLGEPSRRGNTASTANIAQSELKRALKLTAKERALLFDNDGCLCCCKFFAGHRANNCPNDFPSPVGYTELTQKDVNMAKTSHTHTVAVVASTLSSCEQSASPVPAVHPVTAVMGSSHFNFSGPSSNVSNVLKDEGSDDSRSVSTTCNIISTHRGVCTSVSAPIVNNDLAPFHIPHLRWSCIATGPAVSVPLPIDALIDNGSHTVLIRDDYVTSLGLRRRRLPVPEHVELAMKNGGKKVIVELREWVKLSLHDLSSLWSSRVICAIIAPGLCSPVILGLPFLHHNHIIVDHEFRTAICKDSGFDLLHPAPLYHHLLVALR